VSSEPESAVNPGTSVSGSDGTSHRAATRRLPFWVMGVGNVIVAPSVENMITAHAAAVASRRGRDPYRRPVRYRCSPSTRRRVSLPGAILVTRSRVSTSSSPRVRAVQSVDVCRPRRRPIRQPVLPELVVDDISGRLWRCRSVVEPVGGFGVVSTVRIVVRLARSSSRTSAIANRIAWDAEIHRTTRASSSAR